MKDQNHIESITLQEIAKIKSDDRIRLVQFHLSRANSQMPTMQEAAERLSSAFKAVAVRLGEYYGKQINQKLKEQEEK